MTLYTYRIIPKAPQSPYLVRSPEPQLDARFGAYLRDHGAQRAWSLLYNDTVALLDFEGVREIAPVPEADARPG
jgi:hypothetical protein